MLHGLLRLPLYLPAATAAVVSLSGTAAGTSSVTGTLTVGHALGGSAAGTSSTTGALTVAHALSGDVAGTSSATGTLTVAHALQGTAAGTSTATGDLTVGAGLAGIATGTSTVTGALSPVARSFAGTAAGTSTATGVLTVAHLLSGTAAGTSSASGALTAGTARDTAWAQTAADSRPAITAPSDSRASVATLADSRPSITAPLYLFDTELRMPLAPAIYLDNDLAVRVGAVERTRFGDYEVELATGLTVEVYLSLTDGVSAAPIHADLVITLAEIGATAVYVGGWQGDSLTTHLTANVDQVVYVVVRVGQDFRAVGEATVRGVRPLGS